MAAVNQLRSSHGLQPYLVDASISAYAQQHSEYQALTDTSTHLHSDGQTSLAHGYVENVAGGDIGYLDAYTVVYGIWSDPVHMKTMVGYASGSAGVGVASNATTTFITLNVRPGGEDSLPGAAAGYTPIALVPLRTATMRSDGAVLHEVGYGQTLWTIAEAYDISLERLRELNGMAADDSSIWAGQMLLVQPGGQVTPTGLPSPTFIGTTPRHTTVPSIPTPSASPRVNVLSSSPAGPLADPPSARAGAARNLPPLLAVPVALIGIGLLLVISPLFKAVRRKNK